jgi:hypothetical protein
MHRVGRTVMFGNFSSTTYVKHYRSLHRSVRPSYVPCSRNGVDRCVFVWFCLVVNDKGGCSRVEEKAGYNTADTFANKDCENPI